MTSCKENGTAPEEEVPRTDLTHGLFLSLGNDSRGLYVLDTQTGESVRAGEGHNEGSTGLAGKPGTKTLFGASEFSLYEIALDGSGATLVGDPSSQALTEGLAYDPDKNILYASSNGFLHLRSPVTGETIETVLSPPNQSDIEGLAFDAETQTLYGLARGFEQQPEFRRALYTLNVGAEMSSWTWIEVGDTGGLWADAGLAFDSSSGMLYATGRMDDPSGLYRIDPGTGNAVRVGDTGLSSAGGGLAWIAAE